MPKILKFFCPYCKNEVTAEATECSSCGTVYGPDTDTVESLEVEVSESAG